VECFRFAYVKSGRILDLAKAGTLLVNATYRADE